MDEEPTVPVRPREHRPGHIGRCAIAFFYSVTLTLPVADEPQPTGSTALLRSLATATVTLAVGLMVLGVMFLVTCETVTVSTFTGASGCTYPFQVYGVAFLYAASLVTIVSMNLFASAHSILGVRKEQRERSYVLSVMGAVALGVVVFLIAFIAHLG